MPDNLNNLLSENPWIGGVIMSVITAVLRVIYDREETSLLRIAAESLLCGTLTITIGSAVEGAGFGSGWYLFIGGTVGFMGVQFVRTLAEKLIKRRVGK